MDNDGTAAGKKLADTQDDKLNDQSQKRSQIELKKLADYFSSRNLIIFESPKIVQGKVADDSDFPPDNGGYGRGEDMSKYAGYFKKQGLESQTGAADDGELEETADFGIVSLEKKDNPERFLHFVFDDF